LEVIMTRQCNVSGRPRSYRLLTREL
jgi:hypothetical protein